MLLLFKNVVFSIFVPGTVAFLLPFALTGGTLFTSMKNASGLALAGWPTLIMGGILYCHCVWNFAWKGDGTPIPIDPPRKLISRGAYLYARNPMYVSVLLIIAGNAFLARQSVLGVYFLVVAAIFHAMVFFYEEPTLRKTFGEEYSTYCRSVRRWGLLIGMVSMLVPVSAVSLDSTMQFQHLYDIPVTGDAIAMTMRADTLKRPFLYIAAKDGGLVIYDISAAPVLVKTVPVDALGSLHVMSLSQAGKRLFLALGNHWGRGQNSGMAVIDVSDPRQASVLGLWRDPSVTGGAGGVEVVGNQAFLGAMMNGLYILDVETPSSIKRISRFVPDIYFPEPRPDPPKFNVRGMAIRDGIVYLCYDAGGLRLIDVRDPAHPVEIGRFSNPAMNGRPRAYNNLVLDGKLAYITVDYVGFEVLDISHPTSIRLISWWNPWNPGLSGFRWFSSPGHANEIALNPERKLVFIAAGRTDLLILSVADPAKPTRVGGFGDVEDKLGTWGVSLSGDLVFLAYIRTLGIPFYANWTGVKALRIK